MMKPKQVKLLQNILILAALVLVVIFLYAIYSSYFSLQLVSGLAAFVFGIVAVILFFVESPQKRPGEQVRY